MMGTPSAMYAEEAVARMLKIAFGYGVTVAQQQGITPTEVDDFSFSVAEPWSLEAPRIQVVRVETIGGPTT
jgi:hypothetical protein